MKMRRFFAPDMRQALKQVRETQGPDAVILSNRKVDGGVEIVAAVDYEDDMLAPAGLGTAQSMADEAVERPEEASLLELARRRGRVDPARRREPAPVAAEPAAGRPRVRAWQPPLEAASRSPSDIPAAPTGWGDGMAGAEAPEPLDAHRASRNVEQTAAVRHRSAAREPDHGAGRGGEGLAPLVLDMRRELSAMRDLMEAQMSGLAWEGLSRRSPVQARLLRHLLELGLDADLARGLAQGADDEDDFEPAWHATLQALARRLPVGDDEILTQGGVVALVGATGVGKTTSVAKLAAAYALRHGRDRVALLSTDDFRIGAQEQLRTFARILGVPMRLVSDAEELGASLDDLGDNRLVLIDTGGVSPRDLRLADQLAALEGQPAAVYLVLAANTQLGAQEAAVQAFSRVPLAGCIATKLDEAASLGPVLSTAARHRLPIAYLGVGQRVPEDLTPANAEALVARAVAATREIGSPLEEETLAWVLGGSARHVAV
jgi:flagellar biosynthesis protein FlhF